MNSIHENNDQNENLINEEEISYLQSLITEESSPNDFERNMISYTASVVQNDIIEGKWYTRLKCAECLRVFTEDEIIDDELVNSKMKTTKLSPASKSTFKICLATEKMMQKFEYKPEMYQNIPKEILRVIDTGDIFYCSDFEHDENHKGTLIDLIIKMNVKKRQTYISHCNTLAAHKVFLRAKLKKLVHFKGQ